MPDATPPPAAAPAAAPATTSPPPDKGHQCLWEGCDKTLPDAELLYIHLCNDHIGRKSTNNLCLTCKWKGCGATCAKRDHITSHLRVHTPLKPHVCEICSKPFKRPQDLKKHEKIHTEEHHMAHRHSKAITVHDENYVERVRAQAPNAAPPRGLDLNSLHPSLAGLGLGAGHNLAYLAGATATREHARSPTMASFAGHQHYGLSAPEFGSVSPRSADEALTPASARISPMPPHADINYGWDTPALGKRGRGGSDPASPSDDFWTDAKKRKFQPTYDAQMAERLSTLSSLGFPPLGAAHPSLALHPNANSPPSTAAPVPPTLPIPDPRSAEELAQWNQYLVKLGEQVASSVYAHALGLAAPPPIAHPPPQQYLDPTALAQFGLAGMPGLLGLGLGLGGLPGLGMLGAGAGLGGVDYNAIAAYQQAQAQALAVQSQIAAGLYPGIDFSALTAAAAANSAAASASSSSDDRASASPPSAPRRPASSSSRRSASASESDFEFDALRPSRAAVPPVLPAGLNLPGFGPVGAGLGDKRSVVPLKSAPPPLKEEDEDMSVDEEKPRLPPPAAPVEPRLGMRTPGMPAKLPASSSSSSGLYPTLPPAPLPSSSGEKIKLPGIASLLEPSFRLRPVGSQSPRSSSSDEEEDDSDSRGSAATSRAGSPSSSTSTVLPSFASIALNGSSNKEVDERLKHIAVIQAMLVAVNREWVEKHGELPADVPAPPPAVRDVEMVA